jgi:predicted GIY-YIG superfamily endonuclease
MCHVYILRSLKEPKRLYIGVAQSLEERLKQHNAGDTAYTKKFIPWDIEAIVFVKSKQIAYNLEQYLKSGSGFAFLKKRLLPKIEK